MKHRAVRTAAILVMGLSAVRAAGPGAERPPQAAPSNYHPLFGDVVRPPGFPAMGKWMIGPDLAYAHWLGALFRGKSLREPFNVVLIDDLASTPEDAVRRFFRACRLAGYSSRPGHSGGYFGWLGGRLFPQTPSAKHHALANEPFELHNNHGRFFGPYWWNGRFYWIGSLSREKLNLARRVKHEFVSFNQARDSFAQALMARAGFRIRSPLGLENAILDDPRLCTGDHDGRAVVLVATR